MLTWDDGVFQAGLSRVRVKSFCNLRYMKVGLKNLESLVYNVSNISNTSSRRYSIDISTLVETIKFTGLIQGFIY